jgi:hypothetical protein
VNQTTVDPDINVAATQVRDFFHPLIHAEVQAGRSPAPPAGAGEPLGLMIAGYDPAGIGRLKTIGSWGNTVTDVFDTTNPGGLWNGEVDVMIRIVKGYDMVRVDTSGWAARNKELLAEAEYLTNFGWFALRDAVDWVTYAVRTTIDTQRFTNGTVGKPGYVPTCGGAIEIATVTTAGIEWVSQTGLRP